MQTVPWPRALVDGTLLPLADAALAITDPGAARGDGAFETVGIWGGAPFALDAHLERLAASLHAILLPPVDQSLLRREVRQLLDGVTGDAALRIYVTAAGTRVLTLGDQPGQRDSSHLVPLTAGWIRPRAGYGPAGAKTMSYLHHMIATRAAQAAGGEDALLVAEDGTVLEGPTFAFYWAGGGVLYAPSTDLGIIDSITRRTVLGVARREGLEVVEGAFRLDALAAADEAMLSSAVRDVVAVRRVGNVRFEGPTPVRDRLSAALSAARRVTA